MLVVGTVFLYFPPVFVFLYVLFNYCIRGKNSVCVVVLGDVGRSPRMQYHALSFVKAGFTVDMVGYGGSEVQRGLQESDRVCLHYLREPPALLKYFPRLVSYLLKIIWQVVSLGTTLLLMPKCGHMLLQNPPCIPSVAVAWLVCWLRRSRLVIDWHNYGYTIMGLTLGHSHIIVRIAKLFERVFGRFSSKNVCVTKAMQVDLRDHWNIKASVVYDRPPEMFQATPLEERHVLFSRLAKQYPQFKRSDGCTEDSTIFTYLNEDNDASYIQNRPAFIISSTSWTEDEDFGMLLSALEILQRDITNKKDLDESKAYKIPHVCEGDSDIVHLRNGISPEANAEGDILLSRVDNITIILAEYEAVVSTRKEILPDIVCVITGKGPLKEFYQRKIESQTWSHVTFCLPWLTPQDYPLLLGSGDLGVCLHKSSSGLDLPMKVVDMFGCGLPVCAVDFECLHELVKHKKNGLIFKDSTDLFNCLKTLLKGFPDDTHTLSQFRKNLASFQATRWQESWEENVLPLFTDNDTSSASDNTSDKKRS